MPLVGKIGPTTNVGSSRASSYGPVAAPVQRALVQIAPGPPAIGVTARPADGRTTAPFLAHLIATDQGAPQTRVRRRIDPNWATTAYGAMMQIPNWAGRRIRESR